MMTNSLQIFNYNGAKVRTVIENGQVWFIAKDVCAVLGLKQVSRVLNGLNKNDSRLLLVTHPQNLSKTLEVNAVNESGLYALVLRSNKLEAKKI